MRFACGDMRDHIVSYQNDHRPLYWRRRALRQQERLRIDFREIFRVVRFSTFATISARSRPLLVPELADCDMADGRAACRRPRRSTTRTMIDPIMFSRSIAWNLILRKSALGFRPGVLERADQQQGRQAGPTLSSTQLV